MGDWIFLRGLIREQRHWGRFIGEFEAGMQGARTHPIDIPGNGELNGLRSPACMADMVDSCRSQAQEQGLAPPYRILAVSMGAMIAADWATTHPGEVHAMVLINTSMRPFNPIHRRLRPQNYLSILKLIAGRANALEWEQSILRMTANQPHEDVLRYWQELRASYPVSARNALRQLWAAASYRSAQQRPSAEILMLASEMDRLVSVNCSRAIADAWNVPLQVHPSAGHDLPLDDGAWVIHAVQRWLRSEKCP